MTIKEYQDLAMRTNDGKCSDRIYQILVEFMDERTKYRLYLSNSKPTYDPGELFNSALGLNGEAGEVADMVKKHFFHGHKLNLDDLIKEIGDVCWYLALTCNSIGISLEEVMSKNIEKLEKRYPEGFSESASINRTE